MRDDIKLKMSMLLDDELSTEDALRLLERIEDDDQLRNWWHRYCATSLALKSQYYVNPRESFVAGVSERVRSESVVMARQSGRRLGVLYSGWTALAASVVIVAVIVIGNLPNQSAPTVPVKLAGSLPIPSADQNPPRNTPPDAKFQDYLEAHNESSYTTVTPNLLPYARVVSHSREE